MHTTIKRMTIDQVKELRQFLMGDIPDGFIIPEDAIPKLTPSQAWTVIWHLGNLYMGVGDNVSRCDVCGDLFDSESDGSILDFGDSPYSFCGGCEFSEEFSEKLEKAPASVKEEYGVHGGGGE